MADVPGERNALGDGGVVAIDDEELEDPVPNIGLVGDVFGRLRRLLSYKSFRGRERRRTADWGLESATLGLGRH